MTINDFKVLLKPITDLVSGSKIDSVLAEKLNSRFPPGSETFDEIEKACHEAIADGWMCALGSEGGPRYGRVIEPGPETEGLSVDVVDLTDWVGSHHRHPKGEVCMVMPISTNARFNGQARGWCVYEPATAHYPTVTDGQALILYMLPDGMIEFTD